MKTRETGNKCFKNKISLVTSLLIVIFLAGCVTLSDPETSQDFNKNSVATVSPDQTVGQTFVARHSNLNGIELWFRTDNPGKLLKIELFHNVGDHNPVYQGYFHTSNGKVHIKIPTQGTSTNQSFYVRLSSSQDEVELLGRDEDNYPQGNATINDLPLDADITFRTTYLYDSNSVLTDLGWLSSKLYLILPLIIILILPGWLLLDIANLDDQLDWGERVAISLGISLAIIPLLMLWTSFVGLRWGPISVWVVSGGLVSIFFWDWHTSFSRKKNKVLITNDNPTNIGDTSLNENDSRENNQQSSVVNVQKSFIFRYAWEILLVGIFSITVFTRFTMVRDLAAPPWVDSIHHGLITRLIMERGGIPESYSPYLPSEADYYHFGFHSALSVFIWLTGYEIHEGMLIFGQVLNSMIVFSIYLLAKTLTSNRSAALTAALIAGVFTLMPAYYTSWGRYTQLVGLLVLPAVFKIFVNTSTQENISNQKSKRLLALGGVTFAGLFLIHYRVTAFLAILMIAYIFSQIKMYRWKNTVILLTVLGLLSVLLLLPWLSGTITNLLIPKGVAWAGGATSFSQIPWNFLKPGLGVIALVMAGVGLILGFSLNKRFPITILLWTGLLYLLANLRWFGFPGSGFVNPASMEITLFMPIAVLGGFAIGGTLEFLDKFIPNFWQIIPRVLFIVIGAISSILGVQRLLPTLNPNTFLVREADIPAIDWIDKNIPESEIIMINPTGWGYGLYMGQDGGYWISPLSGRQTVPPPVLYGLGDRAEIKNTNQFIEELLNVGEDAEALLKLMQSNDIRYVYIGRRGGVISPKALATSGLFLVRYQADGTWVFETIVDEP